MKIDFGGRMWQLDLQDLTNRQAAAILEFTGMPSLSKFTQSLGEEEGPAFLRSWDALYWLMLQQNDQTSVALADVDYALPRFSAAFRAASEAEDAEAKAAEAGPDPTPLPAAFQRSPAPSSPATTKSSGPGGVTGAPDG